MQTRKKKRKFSKWKWKIIIEISGLFTFMIDVHWVQNESKLLQNNFLWTQYFVHYINNFEVKIIFTVKGGWDKAAASRNSASIRASLSEINCNLTHSVTILSPSNSYKNVKKNHRSLNGKVYKKKLTKIEKR